MLNRLLLSIGLSLVLAPLYSQSKDHDGIISINLSIIGKGTPVLCNDSDSYYFAVTRISNAQDTAISFWIMSCSWHVDNWILNVNDSVSLRFCGCDSNIPVEIKLAPKKSIDFYCAIKPRKSNPSNTKIKLGFVYFMNAQDLFNNASLSGKISKFNKYWSNEAELKDNLYEYRIE